MLIIFVLQAYIHSISSVGRKRNSVIGTCKGVWIMNTFCKKYLFLEKQQPSEKKRIPKSVNRCIEGHIIPFTFPSQSVRSNVYLHWNPFTKFSFLSKSIHLNTIASSLLTYCAHKNISAIAFTSLCYTIKCLVKFIR